MKDTNRNFLSVIRRTRINGSPGNGSARFVEYEISCQIRLLAGTLVEKVIVYKWSVWRRFSQFLLLHKVFTWLNSSLLCFDAPIIILSGWLTIEYFWAHISRKLFNFTVRQYRRISDGWWSRKPFPRLEHLCMTRHHLNLLRNAGV